MKIVLCLDDITFNVILGFIIQKQLFNPFQFCDLLPKYNRPVNEMNTLSSAILTLESDNINTYANHRYW